MSYRIVRYYRDEKRAPKTVKRGLSLEQAKERCKSPEASSTTCTTVEGKTRTKRFGAWFEGFTEE